MWSSSGASSDSSGEKAVAAGLRLSVDPTDFVHIEEPDCTPDPRARPLSACMVSCQLEPSSADSRAEARLVNHGAGSGATSSMSDEERIEKMSGAVKTILEVRLSYASPFSRSVSFLVLMVWCVVGWRVRCVNGARAGSRGASLCHIVPHATVKWLGPRPTSRCLALLHAPWPYWYPRTDTCVPTNNPHTHTHTSLPTHA